MEKLIKSFGAFSIGPIAGAAIGLLTVPVTTYFITPEEYGRASMFILAQGLISMTVYLGMDQAFVREFHTFEGAIDRLITNAILIPLILVGFLDFCIILNMGSVSSILFGRRTEYNAVFALVLMLPFMVFENFSFLKIRMEEKGLQYSSFTILLKILTLIFTLGLIQIYEKSFRSVIWAIALSEIINGVVLFCFTMRKVKIKLSYINNKLLKRMLKFGVPLVPAAMLGWLLTSMDRIMLRVMCTYDELGLYSAALKIVNVLGIVQSCFTLFWTPVSYRWFYEKKDESYFDNTNTIVSMVMTSMCLVILLCKNIVGVILGENYVQAIHIFPFLLLHPIMYTMSEITAVGIAFKRKTGYNILVSALSGGVNLGLNYLLVPAMGGKGAAIATGLSYMVFFWSRTIISRKLWHKFKMTPHIIYTLIISVNCLIHTFMYGWIPYIVSIISLVVIILVNLDIIKKSLLMFQFNEKTQR